MTAKPSLNAIQFFPPTVIFPEKSGKYTKKCLIFLFAGLYYILYLRNIKILKNIKTAETMIRNSLTFQFLKNPFSVGAVCPSSPFLAEEIAKNAGLETALSVAELGPGTGALTGAILKRKSDEAKFFAVELNVSVLEIFRKKFPEVKIYNESAAKLGEIARKEGLTSVDSVISGLPWAAFPESLQDELLSAIAGTLSPDGCFSTFSYIHCPLLPAGKRFRNKLSEYFASVETSAVVWRNLPPAFVYRCRK